MFNIYSPFYKLLRTLASSLTPRTPSPPASPSTRFSNLTLFIRPDTLPSRVSPPASIFFRSKTSSQNCHFLALRRHDDDRKGAGGAPSAWRSPLPDRPTPPVANIDVNFYRSSRTTSCIALGASLSGTALGIERNFVIGVRIVKIFLTCDKLCRSVPADSAMYSASVVPI